MLSLAELKQLVKNVIKDANGQKCVVDLGIKVDDITSISHDDMMAIEEQHNIVFVGIGDIVLIKI